MDVFICLFWIECDSIVEKEVMVNLFTSFFLTL